MTDCTNDLLAGASGAKDRNFHLQQSGHVDTIGAHFKLMTLDDPMNFRTRSVSITKIVGLTTGLLCLPLLISSPVHAEAVERACQAPLDADIAGLLPNLNEADLAKAAAAVARELEAIGELVPRSLYDSLDVVTEQGFDPELLRHWMLREVKLLPYQGVLRGAPGVVRDRQGNSLDQALLMSEMLTFAGFDVRLAQAGLSASAANALAAHVATFQPPQGPDSVAPGLAALGGKLGIADAKMMQIQEALRKRNADCSAAIADRINTQATALLDLVGAPNGARANPQAALADHWWVQTNLGQGWQDLDPFSDIIGAPEPDATFAMDTLDDQAQHMVGIRLIGEFRADDAFREETLLEHFVPASEIGFVSSEIYNSPAPGQRRQVDAAAPDPVADFFVATAEARVWLPVLRIGNDRFTGAVFSVDGGVEVASGEVAEALQQAGPGGLSAGLGGLLGGGNTGGLGGGLLGGGAPEPPKPEPLTAIWLEIETTVPGRGTRTHRRDIYDAFGPAARLAGDFSADIDAQARGFALNFRTEIGVSAGTLLPEAATRMQAQSAAGMVRAMEDILAGRTPEDVSFPSSAVTFAMMRAGVSPDGQIGDVAPGVVLIHQGFSTDGSDQIVYAQTIDIVENAVTDPGADFAAHLRAGVADTVIETLLSNLGGDLSNTSVSFAADPTGWATLRGTESLESAALTDDMAARVAADLAAGFVVVAPTSGDLSETYWRIDPDMGTTLGIGSMGRGANQTEYGLILNFINAGQYLWELHPFMMCMLLADSKKISYNGGVGTCMAAAAMFWAAGRTTGAIIPSLSGSPIKRLLLWFGAQIVIMFGENIWHQSQIGQKWDEWKRERVDAVLGR